jgi:hypothetical protein
MSESVIIFATDFGNEEKDEKAAKATELMSPPVKK